MQKLVNVLAVASFLMSGAVVGAGVYVYTQRDALIDEAKARAAEAIGEMIGDQLVGALDGKVGGLGDGLLGGGEESDMSPPVSIPTLPF